MFSPYNEARRRFLRYWPYMSVFERARAVYLVSGERFYKWLGDKAHTYCDNYEKRNHLNNGNSSEND